MARIEDYYLPEDGNDWSPAINRAQREFHTLRDPTDQPGFTLEFGPSRYLFSDTIRLVRSMHLVGASGKIFSTEFKFAADKTGIFCGWRLSSALTAAVTSATQNTFSVTAGSHFLVGDTLLVGNEKVEVKHVSGNRISVLRGAQGTTAATHPPGTVVAPLGFRSDNSIIERLTLLGSGTSKVAHGISLQLRAVVRDLAIVGFSGDGIHIEATHPAGNANCWRVSNVQINNCGGDGVSVAGADANSGHADLLIIQDNGGWAIRDHSAELGNTYISCVAEGNRSGAFNTRRPGGASPRSVFINCDCEGNGPLNQSTIDLPSMVIGSTAGSVTGNGVVFAANAEGVYVSSCLTALSPVVPQPDAPKKVRQVIAQLGAFEQILGALALDVAEGTIEPSGQVTWGPAPDVGKYQLLYDYIVPGWWGLFWNRLNGSPLRISTKAADVGAGQIWCETGIFLGQMLHVTATGSSEAFPPARPGHKPGDIVFNTDPQRGGHVGWVWVAQGEAAGAWKRFGKIES